MKQWSVPLRSVYLSCEEVPLCLKKQFYVFYGRRAINIHDDISRLRFWTESFSVSQIESGVWKTWLLVRLRGSEKRCYWVALRELKEFTVFGVDPLPEKKSVKVSFPPLSQTQPFLVKSISQALWLDTKPLEIQNMYFSLLLFCWCKFFAFWEPFVFLQY